MFICYSVIASDRWSKQSIWKEKCIQVLEYPKRRTEEASMGKIVDALQNMLIYKKKPTPLLPPHLILIESIKNGHGNALVLEDASKNKWDGC